MNKAHVIHGCLFLLLMCIAACNGPRYQKQSESDAGPQPTAVRVTNPMPTGDQELGAALAGVVRATGQVAIAFQVGGLVDEVLVDSGEQVNKGQVLARLDNRIFAAQRDQARGQLNMAQAQLDMALAGTREEDIAQAQAGVESAEAFYGQAEADFERARQLYAEGVISKQSMDAATTGMTRAQKALESAREQLNKAMTGPRPQEIDNAKAAVLSAEGMLAQAGTQLEYAVLTAPVDGTITMREIEPGQTVGAARPVFEIANLNRLEVLTEVPEGNLVDLSVGDEAELTFPALPGLKGKGTITSIAPQAQASTRGFPVKVSLDFSEPGIVPGIVSLVSFGFQVPPDGLVIPQKAIVSGSVFVVEDGFARTRTIEVLLDRGEMAIVSGLEPADNVVINGQHFLSDGDAARIVDALGVEELTRLDTN